MKNQNSDTDNYVHGMDWAKKIEGAELSNYKRYQFNLVAKYMGKTLLEVGSGNRMFTRLITQNHAFDYLLSIEPSETLYSLYDGKYQFGDDVEFEKIDLFNLTAERYGKFDTITMIHVLEHIKDDGSALDHLANLLEPQGYLLIEVPALPFLFSPHDTMVGHYRRYTKKSLKAAVNLNKYEIVDIWYQDPIGILGSLIFFKIMKVRLKSEAGSRLVSKQGKFYDTYLIPLQEKMESVVKPPIGLSLTAILRRR